MLKRITILAACLASFAAMQTVASGATVTLKNGDRISGTILSQEDGKITIETELLGTITVPADGATVEGADAEAVAEPAAPAAATEEQTPPGELTPEEVSHFYAAINAAREWVDSIVPEGWSGRFQFGANFTETSSKTTGVNLGMNAAKDSGLNHYSINAFYDYKTSTNQAGVEDKQLDKWGGGFKYRRDIGEHFFFLANTAYLRDQVKDIRNQITQDIGIGYYFFNEEDIVLYIAPAFTPQYKDAKGVSKKWYYMATILQEFKYKINNSVRIEQNAQGSIEPGETENYTYSAKVSVITKLTDWIDLIVSYNYSWDNTVGSGGSKREQIASVSLGIPF